MTGLNPSAEHIPSILSMPVLPPSLPDPLSSWCQFCSASRQFRKRDEISDFLAQGVFERPDAADVSRLENVDHMWKKR
jgi:hypothetical protein